MTGIDDRLPAGVLGQDADDDALWAIFSTSRNPMLLADDQRRYVNANTAALALLGYDMATIRTMRIDDVAIPEARPFMDDVWTDFLDRGGSIGHFAIVRSDGTPVTVEFNATANVRPGLHLALFINPLVTGDPQGLDEVAEGKHSVAEPVDAVARAAGASSPRSSSGWSRCWRWGSTGTRLRTSSRSRPPRFAWPCRRPCTSWAPAPVPTR